MTHSQHKQTRKIFASLSGFTLVELIVVITIVAILGTISFIAIIGYVKSARDSKRITNVWILAQWFNTIIARGNTINTAGTSTGANLVIVGSGLTMTGYYGPVNTQLIDSLKVFGEGLIVYDGFQQYNYSYFPREYMYQVMATLESTPGTQSAYLFSPHIIDTVYATTQTGGYAYIKGNFSQTGGIISITPDPSVWETRTPDPITETRTFSGSEMILDGGSVGVATPPIPVVNGVCDITSSGQSLSATPTILCSAGTPTTVVDGGVGSTYTWSCLGSGGGADISCSANHVAANCTLDGSELDNCNF